MFHVNYNSDGAIIGYGSSKEDAAVNDALGLKTLTFNCDIPGFINSNGACMMKVDVENRLLVFKNPTTIPKPIE